jgi:hypothetical protein
MSLGIIRWILCNQLWKRQMMEADDKAKLFFAVKYKHKEGAKSMGMKWDSRKKAWYSYIDNPRIDEIRHYFDSMDKYINETYYNG